jgi:hypothetical protein
MEPVTDLVVKTDSSKFGRDRKNNSTIRNLKMTEWVQHVTIQYEIETSQNVMQHNTVQLLNFLTFSSVLFFYLKHSVTENSFCLRLQVKAYQAKSIELVHISGHQRQLSRFHLKTETKSWIMSRNTITVVIYHRHTNFDILFTTQYKRDSAVQRSAAQHSTAQHSTAQHSTAPFFL